MDASTTLKKLGLEKAFRYLYKNPEENLITLINWADKFSKGEFVGQRRVIREVFENPEHPYHSYVLRLLAEVVLLLVAAALGGQVEEWRVKATPGLQRAARLHSRSRQRLRGMWR